MRPIWDENVESRAEVMGDLGSTDCPANSVPLEDAEACEAASKALAKEYVELNEAEGDPRGSEDMRNGGEKRENAFVSSDFKSISPRFRTLFGRGTPAGCQFRPPDQDVYFNSHSRGAPNPGRQPICREDAKAAALITTEAPKFNFEWAHTELHRCVDLFKRAL